MAAPTPAIAFLDRLALPYTVHSYPHDPAVTAYGQEAVTALGLDPEQVFKTLVVDVLGKLVVAVLPVAAQLDAKALAAALGAKHAELADRVRVERATGYVLGGVSPLGQRQALPTVLDASALEWPTIHVSAGRRGLEVELSPTDLLAATTGRLAPIARRR